MDVLEDPGDELQQLLDEVDYELEEVPVPGVPGVPLVVLTIGEIPLVNHCTAASSRDQYDRAFTVCPLHVRRSCWHPCTLLRPKSPVGGSGRAQHCWR